MPKIKLSNGKIFEASSEPTILSEGRSRGILLEHSCRTGRCGICKVRVIRGVTRISQPEEALSADARQAGFILTCCRSAVTDVELDAHDLGRLGTITTKTLPCRIDELDFVAIDVIRIRLRIPSNSQFEYVAGQYIDIIGPAGVRRSYSIANSWKNEGDGLELHIKKVPEGVMSDYWFTKAVLNDLLRFEGPLGTFSFRENEAETIIFLATGTGMAPVKAMLESLESDPELIAGREIRVYWGARSEADFYQELNFPTLNMTLTHVLSQPDSTWNGRRGYVQNCVIQDKIKLEKSVVYACGSDIMIRASRELLVRSGLDSKWFYSDAFVSSN